jgi:hypothetical protein
MNDMSKVITPKSDQMNADDLISGPRTITITEVDIRPGTEQPVSIFFEGDENKPYKPCKSMSRVFVSAWGPDAKAYIGRSVTLYRDPKVKWGGMEIGGIRISHMSHIERDLAMTLTATKGKWTPYKVKPLVVAPPKPSETKHQTPDLDDDPLRDKADWMVKQLAACTSEMKWEALQASAPRLLKMLDERDDLKTIVVDALAFHGKRFAAPMHDGEALDDEVTV